MNPDVIRREIDGTKERIAGELAMLRAREARALRIGEVAALATIAFGCVLVAIGAARHHRRQPTT